MQVLAQRAQLVSMQQQTPLHVRTAQLGRLMRILMLLHRVRAAQLALQQQKGMLANATRAWLVSMRLCLRLSVATAVQARPITTCRRIRLAPRVCRACTQSVGTLASATSVLLGVSIRCLVERAWMRAPCVQTPALMRVLGRRHARSAPVGPLTKTWTLLLNV